MDAAEPDDGSTKDFPHNVLGSTTAEVAVAAVVAVVVVAAVMEVMPLLVRTCISNHR